LRATNSVSGITKRLSQRRLSVMPPNNWASELEAWGVWGVSPFSPPRTVARLEKEEPLPLTLMPSLKEFERCATMLSPPNIGMKNLALITGWTDCKQRF